MLKIHNDLYYVQTNSEDDYRLFSDKNSRLPLPAAIKISLADSKTKNMIATTDFDISKLISEKLYKELTNNTFQDPYDYKLTIVEYPSYIKIILTHRPSETQRSIQI